MANVLRLGDRVQTKGVVPVPKRRGPGWDAKIVAGTIVEMCPDYVRVKIDSFSEHADPARIAYGDLERLSTPSGA